MSMSPRRSAYFRPCCATASRNFMSSSASHGPFLRLPHTRLIHLLRQSLFVRKGSFTATRLQSVEWPICATDSQHKLRIQGSPFILSFSKIRAICQTRKTHCILQRKRAKSHLPLFSTASACCRRGRAHSSQSFTTKVLRPRRFAAGLMFGLTLAIEYYLIEIANKGHGGAPLWLSTSYHSRNLAESFAPILISEVAYLTLTE